MKDMLLELFGLVDRKLYSKTLKEYGDLVDDNIALGKAKADAELKLATLKMEYEEVGRSYGKLEQKYEQIRRDIKLLREIRDGLDRMIEFHFTKEEENRKFEGTKTFRIVPLTSSKK